MKIEGSARLAKARAPFLSNAERGRVLLLAIALVFVAGLIWLWIGAGQRSAGRTLATGSEAPAEGPRLAPEPSPATPLRSEPQPTAGPVDELGPDELEPFVAARTSPERFAGQLGSLRGHIEVTGEEPFPETWRLVVRPSAILAGREHAVSRTLEVAGASKDFELHELPLGGYDVSGEAEGFNGQVLSVMLEAGSAHPFVNLRFVPAGLLEGKVLDSLGSPAEGIAITLFCADQATRETVTDASGVFRFEKLADGAYELLVGKATSPLLPERRPVRFMAPHLTFPDIELPQLGEIHVRVVDSYERPLEGVEVRGSGTNGGLIEGRTDYDGRLVAKHLPPGHFRLRLQHPAFDESYARRVAVDVQPGEVTEAPVRLGP